MSIEKLGKYRVDKAFTEGVQLSLDEAPSVIFIVRLPGQYNRAYMAGLYGAIEVDFNEKGESSTTTNVLAARDLQEAAFVSHCLVSIDGEPLPGDFAAEYPKAVDELMGKANDALATIEGVVEDAVKKSRPSLVGSADGASA